MTNGISKGLFVTAVALALFSLATFTGVYFDCFPRVQYNLYITSLILAFLAFIFGLTTIIIMRVHLYDPYCGGSIENNVRIVEKEQEDDIGIHLAMAGTVAMGLFALLGGVLHGNFKGGSNGISSPGSDFNVGSLLF